MSHLRKVHRLPVRHHRFQGYTKRYIYKITKYNKKNKEILNKRNYIDDEMLQYNKIKISRLEFIIQI